MTEKFENPEKRPRDEKNMSRRKFLKIAGAGTAAFSLDAKRTAGQEPPSINRFEYAKHGWFYTLEEMQKIYDKEYYGEKLLRNIVHKSGEKLQGIYLGEKIDIHPKLIKTILSHLKSMLEEGAAKFLFRLDAGHGHYFFVPKGIFESRYRDLGPAEKFRIAMEDKALGILYHNLEHLKIQDANEETLKLYRKRNIIGWSDGRPITILPLPKGRRSAASTPEGYINLPITINFAAHKDGEFSITVREKEIRVDISFYDANYF